LPGNKNDRDVSTFLQTKPVFIFVIKTHFSGQRLTLTDATAFNTPYALSIYKIFGLILYGGFTIISYYKPNGSL